MEFKEGNIQNQKFFNTIVFPKTLLPPENGACTADMLTEMVREKKEWLEEILKQHSAILFRGFPVKSSEDFSRVVEAFGWEEMPYFGFISRAKVADRVFTANEAPLHKPIGFHHEMATVKEYPSKIFFFCDQPSPKDGETSILPGHIILEKMEEILPDFVSKLRNLGYVFKTKTAAKNDETNNVISKTWKVAFETENIVEATKRAKEKLGCTSVKFNEDGSAEFIYGPLDPIKQIGDKQVWFYQYLVGRNKGDNDSYFGDGTPIPTTALDTYNKIIKEICVDIKWQKGDVLLVDNLSAQHARRAGEAPRHILVSICK